MRSIFPTCAVFILFFSCACLAENPLTLEIDRKLASEGFLTIDWNSVHPLNTAALQVANDSSFHQLIHNIKITNQKSVHLSGFSDGEYYVRLVPEKNGFASATSSFTVKHRQLGDALALFSVGVALFVFLLATIYRFSKPSASE